MDKYIIKSKYCWDGQSSEVNSDVALYISDGRIAEIGKSNEILNKYPKPFFVAHRGVSELYPENSIPAFEETSKYDKCAEKLHQRFNFQCHFPTAGGTENSV